MCTRLIKMRFDGFGGGAHRRKPGALSACTLATRMVFTINLWGVVGTYIVPILMVITRLNIKVACTIPQGVELLLLLFVC